MKVHKRFFDIDQSSMSGPNEISLPISSLDATPSEYVSGILQVAAAAEDKEGGE